MYKAEHEIHLVRNEQLDRKENAITRCKELENENKTIKEANNYWRSRYCEISNNSIPIQKVKDELEELKGKLEDISRRREKSKTKEEETVLWCLEIRIDERIKTLQELL